MTSRSARAPSASSCKNRTNARWVTHYREIVKREKGKIIPTVTHSLSILQGRVKAYSRGGRPAVSVVTKKKETLGKKANVSKKYRPKGSPLEVDVHDFPDKMLGKAIPYGVYDIDLNEAWVSVGVSRDTAQFAVAAIRQWWMRLGKKRYSKPTRLLITADSGGSNGSRNRLWKHELQRLADQLDLTMEVCHYPPRTSKWNKIEHRLFCHITRNWRGQPLETHQVVISLVSLTRTSEGLEVHCSLDNAQYQTGIKITDAELDQLNIKRNKFHGDWNYEIRSNN